MAILAEHRVDVAEALREATFDGAIWSLNCEQLNVNLMRLPAGATIPTHVNTDLDVLMAVYEGSGELLVDGERLALGPGVVAVIPRGARRAIRSLASTLVYISAHRQRGGLMPSDPPRAETAVS